MTTGRYYLRSKFRSPAKRTPNTRSQAPGALSRNRRRSSQARTMTPRNLFTRCRPVPMAPRKRRNGSQRVTVTDTRVRRKLALQFLTTRSVPGAPRKFKRLSNPRFPDMVSVTKKLQF